MEGEKRERLSLILDLPVTSYVILGKLFNPMSLSILIFKMGIGLLIL